VDWWWWIRRGGRPVVTQPCLRHHCKRWWPAGAAPGSGRGQGVAGRCCLPLSLTSACGRLHCRPRRRGGRRGRPGLSCPCPDLAAAGSAPLPFPSKALPVSTQCHVQFRLQSTGRRSRTHDTCTQLPDRPSSITFRSSSRLAVGSGSSSGR
jgi:hypothetical protein